MSDFRGMGVFSLIQLNYFADKYAVEAQRWVQYVISRVWLAKSD